MIWQQVKNKMNTTNARLPSSIQEKKKNNRIATDEIIGGV